MKKAFFADDIKIAVIGGGTGSFTLLTELKNRTEAIAALVNMADDGGSTGVLRDELGALPPGDIRQCLVALSDSPELRDLFNYRFDEGSFKGHAFGNIFISALEKMTGDFAKGVELASEVLNITGVVEPITLTNVSLHMKDGDGTVIEGEYEIGNRRFTGNTLDFWLEPRAEANPHALKAIERADIVLIAPGNLYGSLAPALLVDGVGEALAASQAMKLYICNLVTKPGQTDGYTVTDFADEIERLAGTKFLDAVIYNTDQPSQALLDRYASEGELAVLYDEEKSSKAHYDVVGAGLLSGRIWRNKSASDPIASTRTLIRHDPVAAADAVLEYYHARS
ncbi:MAG TPA: gluconeogenesis factor YvcK family protein [Patescibacteria group bacterium]|jgi:uncharacterized cofD-like protein|nr:gluconeogenesis factor YvcK family protein [Patescibacteria group bacterium]